MIAHGGAKGALAELGIVLLVALLVAATVKIRGVCQRARTAPA